MTVRNAIDILKRQKTKIDDFDNRNQNWVFQTASYIKDFFGEDSTEFSFICQFKFSVVSTNWDRPEDVRRWLSEKPVEARHFLDNCIETLQHKGLHKQPKQNFLNRMSDTALWTIISIGIPGLISIGLFFGNLYSDKQNIDLRQENKTLRDSLSILRPFTNKVTNDRPDTVIQKAITNDTPKK